MIGVDSIARGGGNATAVATGVKKGQTQSSGKATDRSSRSKKEDEALEDSSLLSAEDEERM